MPCNSGYLAATKEESDSRKFCGLLSYVLKSLGRDVPQWAEKAKDEYYGDTRKVNDAVVLLCATIRQMTPDELGRIVYDGRNKTARALADFWDRHEETDERRAKKEEAEATKAKLSDEAEFERLKAKLGK